jgi:protoporphyrinogen oxidase
MSDDQLARRCIEQLQRLRILRVAGSGDEEFFSRRLKTVYPVYDLGWRQRFERVYQRLDSVENLYMIGRSALFLHCNIDHCMSMALHLSRHLVDGRRGKDEWDGVRQRFFDYRVRE